MMATPARAIAAPIISNLSGAIPSKIQPQITAMTIKMPPYAAYGGIFIVMALVWGWIFEGIAPDRFDVIGAAIALAGVAIIFYIPRKGEAEKAVWSN